MAEVENTYEVMCGDKWRAEWSKTLKEILCILYLFILASDNEF